MTAAFSHKGRELLMGETTESGEYQATRVDGKWYFHPTSNDWLTFNGDWEFSEEYDTESEALEAAELQEQEDYQEAE